MTTATIETITTPTSAARYEVYFDGMERSRTLFVEADKLHLQMTLICDCNRCRDRESMMLSSLRSHGIPYTVEVMLDGNQNERFVCFARKDGQDPIEQVKADIGIGVWLSTQQPTIAHEQRNARNKTILATAEIIMGIIAAIALCVWLYRFIHPDPSVFALMGAWASLHLAFMLLRDLASKEKLARFLSWLSGVGAMLAGGTFVGLMMRIDSLLGNRVDHFMNSLPLFFQMLGGFVCIIGILGCFLIVLCAMMGQMVFFVRSWMVSDYEVTMQ